MCFFDFLKRKFPKSSKTLGKLQRIVRILALTEGILGLAILIAQLTIRTLRYDKALKNSRAIDPDHEEMDEEQRTELTKIIVLALFGLQAIFAIILFEGARRKIMCMIKAWLIFCFIKLFIAVVVISYILLRQKKKLKARMWWTLGMEIASASFQIVESLFVLAFHHQANES